MNSMQQSERASAPAIRNQTHTPHVYRQNMAFNHESEGSSSFRYQENKTTLNSFSNLSPAPPQPCTSNPTFTSNELTNIVSFHPPANSIINTKLVPPLTSSVRQNNSTNLLPPITPPHHHSKNNEPARLSPRDIPTSC